MAAPRAGKVVRVERKQAAIIGAPRYCTISPMDNIGYCITTKAPEVGERLTVLDSQRVLGTIRITQVTALADGCSQSSAWMTQGTLDSGDLSNPNGVVVGVLDVPVDLRSAKLISVDKSPSGHPWGTDTIYAIDNNNDGGPDLEFVQYGCDDSGNTSSNPTGTCSEVWTSRPNRGLVKIRQERVVTCY